LIAELCLVPFCEVPSVRTVAGSLAKSLAQRMIGCQDVARRPSDGASVVFMSQNQRTGDVQYVM